MNNQDTIAAIATPFGTGGVGIIRVSGTRSCEVAKLIFQPTTFDCPWETHHLYHGHIVSSDGTILDEVLISLMRSPHSFTGEDVLEINCHSSPLILHSILALLVEAGCRLARPGEFSQRAFLNSRMDLSQAEGLATLVAAKSAKAASIGLAQLKGELGNEIDNLRNRLIEVVALLEAEIDFSEDVSEGDNPVLPPQVDQVLARIQLLLSSYNAAKACTEGLNVVITGKPNVGKSSLLNWLTGKKKAIVTDIPGTTRDLITDTIIVRGIPLNLVDTAGLRAPQCSIEKEGIDLVWEALANAHMIIILLDGSRPLTGEDTDIFRKLNNSNYLVAINKSDLPALWDETQIRPLLSGNRIFRIAAKYGAGIEGLKDALVDLSITCPDDKSSTVMINNIRHKIALEKGRDNIIRAKENIGNGMSTEFAAFDLREAINNLDEITGKKIDDAVLDKIFSSFCIGK